MGGKRTLNDSSLLMRKRPHLGVIITFVTLALLIPAQAYANAGVPMVFITLPAMLLALIPIILIETAILERALHLGYRQIAWRVAIANAVSTIVGYPLTWILTVALQMVTGGGRAYGINTWWSKVLAVTWQSPWLIPYEGELYWMIPVAALVGLVPAYFASVFVEGHILKRSLKTADRLTLWKLTWKANQTSYLLLAGVAVAWLLYSVISNSRPTRLF